VAVRALRRSPTRRSSDLRSQLDEALAGDGHDPAALNQPSQQCRPKSAGQVRPALGPVQAPTSKGATRPACRFNIDAEVRKPRFTDRKSTRLNSSHVKISY